MRKAAFQTWDNRWDNAVILRTDYSSPSGESKMNDWIEIDKGLDPDFEDETLWWRVLNDPGLFNFGSHYWELVFTVLPELAGPGL